MKEERGRVRNEDDKKGRNEKGKKRKEGEVVSRRERTEW